MNKLNEFFYWYRGQCELTLIEWKNKKFKPVVLIFTAYGAAICNFILVWPMLGYKKATFLSGATLVFLSLIFGSFLLMTFLARPFERLYESKRRAKLDNPKNF